MAVAPGRPIHTNGLVPFSAMQNRVGCNLYLTGRLMYHDKTHTVDMLQVITATT